MPQRGLSLVPVSAACAEALHHWPERMLPFQARLTQPHEVDSPWDMHRLAADNHRFRALAIVRIREWQQESCGSGGRCLNIPGKCGRGGLQKIRKGRTHCAAILPAAGPAENLQSSCTLDPNGVRYAFFCAFIRSSYSMRQVRAAASWFTARRKTLASILMGLADAPRDGCRAIASPS